MNTNLERIQKDIEALAQFTSTPGVGTTRFSFSKEDRAAREYIRKEMREAGLKVYEDTAGTLIGRLEGEKKEPVIMIGSHFDSVKNGGNFDGQAGVVTALEIARVFKEKKLKPKYTVEFVALIEEEGGRFGGGLFGSRAMVGKVKREDLDKFKDEDGISISEAMKDFGLNPDKIEGAIRKPEDIKCFLELHIEQGPILESENKSIGIVEYIVGIREFEVIIKGRPDHAGTTPMNMRADALDGGSRIISKISNFAKEVGFGSVATVGKLNVWPGAANIVPERVNFLVDIRSKKWECIEEIKTNIEKEVENVCKDSGLDYEIIHKIHVKPVKVSENIVEILKENCEKLQFSQEIMLSGAGHDAMVMGEITDIGMIFVPSKGGRSHCPEEWTDYEALQKGVELSYYAVKKLSEAKCM
ncbi:Zn-dependent hydrolase [uncultured Clostridium sp.]|uniref:Zn-dependent hydrolase n=1 Tax=uncultured Clostridium sp. TaxID=59620 RepID=UPI0028ECAF9D|nr:Zn-dependent hydrolase [uncultured Clostridium sp.]